jgi:hypothetical protein
MSFEPLPAMGHGASGRMSAAQLVDQETVAPNAPALHLPSLTLDRANRRRCETCRLPLSSPWRHNSETPSDTQIEANRPGRHLPLP